MYWNISQRMGLSNGPIHLTRVCLLCCFIWVVPCLYYYITDELNSDNNRATFLYLFIHHTTIQRKTIIFQYNFKWFFFCFRALFFWDVFQNLFVLFLSYFNLSYWNGKLKQNRINLISLPLYVIFYLERSTFFYSRDNHGISHVASRQKNNNNKKTVFLNYSNECNNLKLFSAFFIIQGTCTHNICVWICHANINLF